MGGEKRRKAMAARREHEERCAEEKGLRVMELREADQKKKLEMELIKRLEVVFKKGRPKIVEMKKEEQVKAESEEGTETEDEEIPIW